MPGKEGFGPGQEAVGDGVAVEILNDHELPSNTMHFENDAGAILIAEVVQE